MLGVPAMRKLAKEIVSWTDTDCYRHMIAYAGLSPPLIDEDLSQNDGLRFEQARLLKEMGQKHGKKKWEDASPLFAQSGELVIKLCESALTYDGTACSGILEKIADIEAEAYATLA